MNKMINPIQTSEMIIENQKISYIFCIKDTLTPLSVFLHGWGSSGNAFFHLFAHQKNFVAIDFPSSGKSSPLQKIFTLEDYARITNIFLENFLQKNTFPENFPLSLIGHSFGGRVIAKLLQIFPENFSPQRLQKIIFIAVPFYREKNIKTMLLGMLFSGGKKFIPRFLQARIKKIAHIIFGENDYFDLAENEIMKRTFQNIVGEEIFPYLTNLKNFSPNTLFCFWGEKDAVIPISFAYDLQKEISDLRIFAVAGVGHFPWIHQNGEKNSHFMQKWENVF